MLCVNTIHQRSERAPLYLKIRPQTSSIQLVTIFLMAGLISVEGCRKYSSVGSVVSCNWIILSSTRRSCNNDMSAAAWGLSSADNPVSSHIKSVPDIMAGSRSTDGANPIQDARQFLLQISKLWIEFSVLTNSSIWSQRLKFRDSQST